MLPVSGHGGQILDKNGDEVDGYDEGSSFDIFPLSLRYLISVVLVIYTVDGDYILDDVCL